MQRFCLLMWIVFSFSAVNARSFYGEKTDTARGDATIKNATVYFGYGAELEHETRIKVDADTKIIVINGLSTQVDIASLQISCPENVALLSQRFRVYYPPAPTLTKSKEVERLEDSMKLLRKDIQRIDNLIDIEQEILAKTGRLIEAAIGTDGTKTITSAEVLKLVDYYNNKIDKSKNAIFNYNQNREKISQQLVELQKRINVLMISPTPAPKPYGQITLQVLCKKAEDVPLSLSYYIRQAGWTPVYDIRVNSKTNKVKLVYKANLTQTSGIDWKKTKLTLSTGTPNFGVNAPVLSAWYLQLYVPELYKSIQGSVPGVQLNRIQSMKDEKQLGEVAIVGYGTDKIAVQNTPPPIVPSTLEDYVQLNEGQLNTNFEIDLPYDVDGDGQLHSVSIKEEEMQCTLKNYGVPRIDKEAYLLAEVADWESLDLLPGDANIVMDDTYIGKSIIDPNSTADTLNLSLGKDKRLAVKRTLLKELSSLKTSGKDSRQTFTYEITVKNNKQTDVNLLLKDQYPLSNIKEVEVKLDESSDAMVNSENGVLTWKVALKPGESKKFRFAYSVKYPKEQKIINLK